MRHPADSFKILAVDTRLKIIDALKRHPMTVNALAEALGVTQSAVSQHLRVLKHAGLAQDERKGYWVYYSLNEDALSQYRKHFMMTCSCHCNSDTETQKAEQSKSEALKAYKKELKRELEQVENMIEKLEE